MKLLRNNLKQVNTTFKNITFLWMAVVFLFIAQRIDAQQLLATVSYQTEAYYHLKQLQKGTLIVVLKSDKKKRAELQKIIDSESSSSSQRKRAQKQLKASVRELSRFHIDLISSFEQVYTFSDYRFIYDGDLQDYMDGARNKFLNNQLEHISEEDSFDGPIYYAREAYTLNTEGTRVLSYIVFDEEARRLKAPFPSVKISRFVLSLLFKSPFDKYDYREGIMIVERFDHMLKYRMASLKEKLD